MERELSEEDGRQALRDHILQTTAGARERYGGSIGHEEILRMLEDRHVVRYPTVIRFASEPLEPGEFAHAEVLGDRPRDGFCIFIDPSFERRPDVLPLLIAYHLVRVNYGDIATAADAELFGATLLGLEVDDYYDRLCALADGLGKQTAIQHTRCSGSPEQPARDGIQ